MKILEKISGKFFGKLRVSFQKIVNKFFNLKKKKLEFTEENNREIWETWLKKKSPLDG